MPEQTSGVWMNKQQVVLIELPIPHEYSATAQGWKIEMRGAGKLVFRVATGPIEHFDVVAGDVLFSSGADLYLSVKSLKKAPR